MVIQDKISSVQVDVTEYTDFIIILFIYFMFYLTTHSTHFKLTVISASETF